MTNRFPRLPLLLTVAALAAALCGCQFDASKWNGAQGVQATETANETGSVLGSANEPQATPAAFLMGENQAAIASTPLPTIDNAATQMFYVDALRAANEHTNQLQKELSDQKLAALQVQAQIERAKADAAKYEAANRASSAKETQSAVDMAANVAAQKEADNEAVRLEIERLKALQGNNNILALCIAALVLVSVILVLNRVFIVPHLAQAEAAEPEPIEREELSPLGTAQYPGAIIVAIPQYIASDRQLKIVADALAKGTPLTHANFTPFEKCFSEGGFTKFCDYLLDNVPPFAVLTNPTIKNSAIEPLPSLRHYLRRYTTPTTPPAKVFTPDTTTQPVDRQTDTPTDTHTGAGEGIPGDAIIKIDPGDAAAFGAALEDAKDVVDEKDGE